MLRRATILLSLVLPFVLLAPSVAAASYETDFVSRTNGSRTSRGLAPYAVRYDLTAVARRQASRMAAAHRIFHNPNLGGEVGNWRALAENVGRGGSVSSIQSAFMSSPSHRANILSTLYTEVGIGAARGSDGQIYVSEVFRLPARAYAPRPTYRRPTTRASRSAPRARPAAVPPKRVAPDPLPGRLDAAWRMYRRERPVTAFERATTYLHVGTYLADYRPVARH